MDRSSRTRAPATATIATLLVISISMSISGLEARAGADEERLSGRGVVFGAFVEDRAGGTIVDAQRRFERAIGHRLRATRVYLKWDSHFPNHHVSWLKRKHRTIVLSVRAMRNDGSIIPWRSIADAPPGSDLHATIVRWAQRIRAFDQQIYFIFNHEPEARSNDALGSPADFIAAWRKIVGIFRAEGTRNVSWTWTMTDWAFETTDERAASNWYPGDDVVDVIGADLYNFADCSVAGRRWETFREKLLPIRAWAKAHPGKPIVLPEWGTTEDASDPGRKARWIRKARSLLKKSAWRRVKMVLYFQTVDSSLPRCTWPVHSSSTALAAFGSMASDPYYDQRG